MVSIGTQGIARRSARRDGDRNDEIRVAVIVTVGLSIRCFFRGQFAHLQKRGFRFTVIAGAQATEPLGLPPEVTYHTVPLTRAITPLRDLLVLWRLFWLFRRGRFDLVQYSTPKAALLGSIAAFLARVRVRHYAVWGLYYLGQRGLKRKICKMVEWVTCRISTHLSFVSADMRAVAIQERVCSADKSGMIANGSSNGIDLGYFRPEEFAHSGKDVRRNLGIPQGALVIGTACRLVGDKGVNELVAAFDRIAATRANVYLLLVGDVEERDRPRSDVLARMLHHPRIVMAGHQSDVRPYYAAMDVFCLPTYREGLGMANLEAAAMRLPVVTTDVPGAREGILDGRTGALVPARRVQELVLALTRLLDTSALRQEMGRYGREWVAKRFEQGAFWDALHHRLQSLLVAGGSFAWQPFGVPQRPVSLPQSVVPELHRPGVNFRPWAVRSASRRCPVHSGA